MCGLEIGGHGPPQWYGPPKPWPPAQRPTILLYHAIPYHTILYTSTTPLPPQLGGNSTYHDLVGSVAEDIYIYT